ncbi:MAG: hypothetical protein ACRDO7_03525 [Nocardioidaceae bacterium]
MSAHDLHFWRTASRHSTSDGMVSYQRCACGTWRITLSGTPYEVHAVRDEPAA